MSRSYRQHALDCDLDDDCTCEPVVIIMRTKKATYTEFRDDWEGEIIAQDDDGSCEDGVIWFWDSMLEAVVSDGNLAESALDWPAPAWLVKLDAGRTSR